MRNVQCRLNGYEIIAIIIGNCYFADMPDRQNTAAGLVTNFAEFWDHTTGWHVIRTQKYLQALVEQLIKDGVYADELLSWNMDMIIPAVPFHDVGKISICQNILKKPGKLTAAEFDIMKTHVQKGVEVIRIMGRYGYFSDFLDHARAFAAAHHEKWDGSGYPSGLKGQEIPLEGRIMAVADVYDALISERPYKRAFSSEESARIIIEGANKHFDPVLVDAFKKLINKFAAIANDYKAKPPPYQDMNAILRQQLSAVCA